MSAAIPRVVVVTRPTVYEHLLRTHGTTQQARFVLESRGRSMDEVLAWHRRFDDALRQVMSALPLEWRRSRVDRSDLDRFLFEPDDTVVVVGQDGLVANVAKYLEGQPVVGINPMPGFFDGVLVPHAPHDARRLLPAAMHREATVQQRTMVQVELDDGQRLVALNELFVGHRTHQSARYRLRVGDAEERQSSSGLIVATGTGATGWARSIVGQRRAPPPVPAPEDPWLTYLVREPFPSQATGTTLDAGPVTPDAPLQVISELDDDGVVFGDGIEADRLAFAWGATATITPARQRLALVTG